MAIPAARNLRSRRTATLSGRMPSNASRRSAPMLRRLAADPGLEVADPPFADAVGRPDVRCS
jgi:hypothetical protein